MTKQNLEFNNEETKKGNQLRVQLDETKMELGIMDKKEKMELKTKTNKNKLFCRCPKSFSNYKNIKRYLNSLIVRFMFLGIPCFHIYFVSCIYSNSLFFFLFAYIIVILADGVYVLMKRHGHEHHW